MNTYIVTCLDKKNSIGLRLSIRQLHLNYLKSLGSDLLVAGPLLDSNDNPKGSVLILNFKNIEELNEFLNNDPYKKANLFEEIKVEKFRKVL
jgi:uncharacterized protein YciI